MQCLNAPSVDMAKNGAPSRAEPLSRQMARCLSIAGLWEQWRDPETSHSVLSATLIVTAANEFTRPIHDRMPVLLGQHDLDVWLTGKAGVELLRPTPNDLLRMWPVSKRVNAGGLETMTQA